MKRLRLLEMTLLLVGVSLLGIAAAGTASRWKYQAEQERALFKPGPAVPAVVQPDVVTVPIPVDEKPRVTRKKADAFARLEIPRLRVKAIVKDGNDEKTLLRAVGRVPGSARPGDVGKIVLAGHRDTFFYPLQDIRTNDRIRLVVPPDTYEYRVQSVSLVEPNDTAVLQSRGVEELTLVTCYPFHAIGPAPLRFIVNATRVSALR
jgi:sortase A